MYVVQEDGEVISDAEAIAMLIQDANDVARRFRQPPLAHVEEELIRERYWRNKGKAENFSATPAAMRALILEVLNYGETSEWRERAMMALGITLDDLA